MGGTAPRKSIATKAGCSKKNNKQYTAIKQAAKKKHHKWSKDRSERVRDALNRDTDLLYSALENPSMLLSFVPPTDSSSVVLLAESMQSLGRDGRGQANLLAHPLPCGMSAST